MKNKQQGDTLQTTDAVGLTETANIKAIGLEILYTGMSRTGFQILYENGKTINYDLCYMDRTTEDFVEGAN
jgi:hypothetical protein